MHRASANSIRRFIGISGIILSGLIILSVIAYLASARPGSLSAAARHSSSAKSVAPPAPACTTPQHPLGDNGGSIMSGSLKRTFLVHLPPSYGKHPQALVISYHGYSWTTHIMEVNTQMNAEADKAGFVLVYPQGTDSPPSWNAGVGAYGPTGDADDIQFTRDLLTYLERNYCVDAHRVYIAGFSLGGGMAYRIACTLSDQIAAVATVEGAYYPFPGGCHPSRPLPVLEIHGAADQLAPYDGNPAAHMASVQSYLNVWLTEDKCSAASNVFFQQGDVTATAWTHCAPGTEVVHYRVSDGGHTWPGTPHTTHVIDANVVIWQFFSKFSH